jgi:ABC-type multidrug transport system fused ATPase/permease subunit
MSSMKDEMNTNKPMSSKTKTKGNLRTSKASKLQDTRMVLKNTVPYLKPYLGPIIGMYVAVLVNVASQLAIPLLVQLSIDEGIVPGNLDKLLGFGAALLGLAVFQYISHRIQGTQLMHIGNGLLRDMRRDMFARFVGFRISYFDSHRSGDLITRATNDLIVLEELIMTGFDTLFVDILMLIGLITVMVLLSPWLSLILLIVVPLLAALVFGLRNKITQTAESVQGNVSQVNSFLNEALSGIRVIRAFSKERESIEVFRGYNNNYYASNKRLYPLTAIFWQSIATLNVLGQTLVILLGGLLFHRGMLTLGVIGAFLGYITRLFQPMQKLSNLINQLGKGIVSGRRIFEILNADQSLDEVQEQNSTGVNQSTEGSRSPSTIQHGDSIIRSIRGEVEFQNVNFAYRIDEPVLRNISFRIEPGTTCALTGHSGSGKTTLVNLVSGFYPALSGTILIDGVAMDHHHLPSLRRSMAAVMQDPQLFSGTIYDNIRLGKPNASDTEIQEICSTLGFHETILNFSRGYDTIIGEEGGTISPGQKQLIAFARAMIRNPSILILDEASAYLDMSMERSIQQALLTLMKNRTSFVIAHRLSTIRNADVIFYLEDGQIVETGSHDQLVMAGGRYAELYKGSVL